jgi:tetratricopeptide (TPR) repeat protein/ribosomal protein L40E
MRKSREPRRALFMVCQRCNAANRPGSRTCQACGARQTPDATTGANESGSKEATRPISAPPTPATPDADVTRLVATSRSTGPEHDVAAGADAARPVSADGPLAPGHQFDQRYRIIRLLGLGGMGAVYEAWDEELGVVVALKVIRPDAAADPESARMLERRFKQELLLARQVTHENVVRIHDLGEVDGIKYITMPFIQGEDLASILKREETLPVPRVMKIARTTISGLAAAHAAGVVHRDLKPANLMIEASGASMIMDFGIARSSATDSAHPHVTLVGNRGGMETVMGAVIGTVEYMAPEQARAEHVDHRADIYAFGLILYDALLGRRRLNRAESAIAELTSRLVAPPPPVRSVAPEIPEPLEAIVMRCLQPAPGARYQSAHELEAALDALDDEGKPLPSQRRITPKLVAGVLALFASLLALTWWLARAPAPVVEPAPVSVLVADFDNATGDQLFEGVVEQGLSIGLEEAPFVTVYPRTDARGIAARLNLGPRLDEGAARLLSRREGIKVVIAGSIAAQSGRYAISARVVDPALDPMRSQPLVTATATAASKGDVLRAVATLASRLRRELGDTKATKTGPDTETFTATSLDALSAYTRAQALNYEGRQQEALAAYEEAVRLDPGMARAYSGMGAIYAALKQDERARANYSMALKQLDRMTEREKFRTLGGYYLVVTHDYEQAVQTFEELVRLYPADDTGHTNLAFANLNLGHMDKAVEQGRKAVEIYPRNRLLRVNYSMYAMYAGNFPTAIAEAQAILKEHPSYVWAHLTRANAHVAARDLAAGRAAFDQLAQQGPDGASMANLGQADLALYSGRTRDAVRLLKAGIAADEAANRPGNAAAKYVALAEALLATGDRRGATNAARRATTLREHQSVLFPAALVLTGSGQTQAGTEVARRLEGMLQRQTTAQAQLIAGRIALEQKRLPDALATLRKAQTLHNSWFARFLLGRAYLEAGRFAEAVAEFETCVRRRGEAADVFFENVSTSRYLPPVYYWLARSQEGLGATAAAKANYEEFLKLRQDAQPPDPQATDARRRAGGL